MKIKRILILLLILLIPFFCCAEECNKNDIKIESIELRDIRGNAEEVSSPNNNNNKINLNTKMNVIGDNITYKVVVKNTSNSDYTFDKNTLTKDYLSYDITYEDDSNIIKPNEEKVIYLRLSYDNKPEVENLVNGVLKENNEVSFDLTKETSFINPETGNKTLLSLIYLLIPVIISFYLIKKKKPTFMLLLLLTIIPYIVNASCTCITTLDINLSLEIDRKEAVFLPGTEVNIKMKQLAGDDTSTVTNGYGFQDQNITAIKKGEAEPIDSNKEEKNIVSTPNSLYPIYMWYEDNTIYWWSEDETPALNENAVAMFGYINSLTDITSLENIDTSNVTNMNIMFAFNTSLSSLESLKKWNTSNVTSMSSLFTNDSSLVSLSGLEYWDTSSVTNMGALFIMNTSLSSLDGIKSWNTKNVTNMANMFSGDTGLTSLKELKDWNTSNVTSMANMFYNDTSLTSLEGLEDWNTSAVTNMSGMFCRTSALTTLKPLKKWNTSNLTTTSSMFAEDILLTSLEGLEDWNTSNVTSMANMFYNDISLTSLEGLEDWDTSSVTTMFYMFHNCLELNDVSALSNWDVSNVEKMSYMFNISNDVASTRKYSKLSQLDISNWNMAKVKDYRYFIESLRYVTTEFTIRSTNVGAYTGMLTDCANKGGEVIINYTSETESIVDDMLTTISSGANIRKGSLVE